MECIVCLSGCAGELRVGVLWRLRLGVACVSGCVPMSGCLRLVFCLCSGDIPVGPDAVRFVGVPAVRLSGSMLPYAVKCFDG